MPKAKQDRDENTIAKSILDEIIAETEYEETEKQKVAKLGGLARAAKLSKIQKSEIAKKAAGARWQKHHKEQGNNLKK